MRLRCPWARERAADISERTLIVAADALGVRTQRW
jgi:hypothetical protein